MFKLLKNLQTIQLEPNTDYKWISADAISMYTNMEINDTINTVWLYLTDIVGIKNIKFNLELLIDHKPIHVWRTPLPTNKWYSYGHQLCSHYCQHLRCI